MLGSNILDIAIGVVFLFLLLSLICSAANELLEGILKNRAADLERGISELLGDDDKRQFVSRIYNHGLINSLYRGSYTGTNTKELPSYIPARNFALALISIVGNADAATLPNNVKSALDAFRKTAVNDVQELQLSIEDWYNSSMDRVSGWYKRRTQIIIFCMGLVLAIVLNADCVNYAKQLSKDSSLRQSVVAMAEAAAKNDPAAPGQNKPEDRIKTEIGTLDAIGIPIGWTESYSHDAAGGFKAAHDHAIGWFLTALAVSLGAPFWFDALNKLMVVRSTVKPHEKSREETSKDASPRPSPTDTTAPAAPQDSPGT
jgi:hypothetical protein